MAKASENYQLLTDYYESFGNGGADGLARMASFYAAGKTNYTAGNSEMAGHIHSPEESLKQLTRLLELNEGRVEILGTPTILLSGDKMVAVLGKERHHRTGKAPMVIPRLYVYEIENRKFTKSFLWQLEESAFEAYYPKP